MTTGNHRRETTRYKDRVRKLQIKNMPSNATANKKGERIGKHTHPIPDEQHEINFQINMKNLVKKTVIMGQNYSRQRKKKSTLYTL